MFSPINFIGFIANEDSILTSLNCLKNKHLNASNIDVVVGASEQPDDKPIVHKVSSIVEHYYFSTYKLSAGFDVAIIKLTNRIVLERSKVEIACLDFGDSKSDENKDDDLLVAGFGVTNEVNQTWTNSLSYAYFKEKSTSQNNEKLIEGKAVIANRTICDGVYGAPLMVMGENGFTKVVGIASYTDESYDSNGNRIYCTDDAYFTRLAYVENFITSSFYLDDKICRV